MSKKGTYNGPFFNAFVARLNGTPIKFGCLVGSRPEEGIRDVVFAVPTLCQRNDDGEPSGKDPVALLKTKGGASYAKWAAQHSSEVRKLLPGGLELCGCFIVASDADAKDLAGAMVPALKGISDPLVLTVDPGSKKIAFWKHEGGAKPALRPATLKSSNHEDSLLFRTECAIDLVLPRRECSSSDLGADLVKALREGLTSSLVSCSVGLAAGSAGLRIVDTSSEAAVSSAASKGCNELQATFLRQGTTLVALPNPDGKPLQRLRCLVIATALCLDRKVELRSVVEQLRGAVIDSAVERLQRALDEEESDDGLPRTRAQLPWRALCRPQSSDLPLWVGEYCMPDEDVDAACERLGEFLGVPASCFDRAPAELDEHARLEQNHAGAFDPMADKEEKPAKSKAAGGVPLPAVAACGAAAVVALLALVVPALLK